jgi:hypothetical protein
VKLATEPRFDDAAATARDHARQEAQGEFGKGADVEVDEAELFIERQDRRAAAQSITGAVDEYVAEQAVCGQEVLETERRIISQEIQRDRERLASGVPDIVGGRRQRHFRTRHEYDRCTIPRGHFGDCLADSPGGTDDDDSGTKLIARPHRAAPEPAAAVTSRPDASPSSSAVTSPFNILSKPLEGTRDVGAIHDPVVIVDAHG